MYSSSFSICFVHLCLFVLVQVCHIVLGLRPGSPEEEGQIIRYIPVFSICHHVYNFEEYAVGPNQFSIILFVSLSVCVQGLVREGEQTWAAAKSQLVPHLHAVVAAVEGLR